MLSTLHWKVAATYGQWPRSRSCRHIRRVSRGPGRLRQEHPRAGPGGRHWRSRGLPHSAYQHLLSPTSLWRRQHQRAHFQVMNGLDMTLYEKIWRLPYDSRAISHLVIKITRSHFNSPKKGLKAVPKTNIFREECTNLCSNHELYIKKIIFTKKCTSSRKIYSNFGFWNSLLNTIWLHLLMV